MRSLLEWMLLLPVVGGSLYTILCLLCVVRLRMRPAVSPQTSFPFWPPVSVLKPVCGLEKDLGVNLRSACQQEYPEFQVVFSVQDARDPAIPLLQEIQREFGAEKVAVAIDGSQTAPNGKIKNLLGALPHARYEYLVISDSDVRLRPDYLKTIIAPLADPEVGCVCTLYKAAGAKTWFEKLELLTLNADFMTNVIFAYVTGASRFCLGASTALRRPTLKDIGGLEALAEYLVEDHEMGRRIWAAGKKVTIVPYFVETMVDLKAPVQWWTHQVYWDQKTCAAQPAGFFWTVLIQAVPFALLFALARGGDVLGLTVLAGILTIRLGMVAVFFGWVFPDREGFKSLALLPLRDVAALFSWLCALAKPTVNWRGAEFTLARGGRIVPRNGPSRGVFL